MTPLLLCLTGSCALCLVLTPLARRLARRCGLVDRPDGRRKIQAAPIPLAGGLAVFASAVAALGGSLAFPGPLRDQFVHEAAGLLGLLGASVAICAVGLADDRGLLRGRHKFLGQVLAVAILLGSGVVVRQVRLFNWGIDLGLLALPFTAFLLLGAINSLNLLDGMDGLLSSVGVIVSLALAVMAALGGHWPAAAVALALAGALLGFLRYNLPPATAYLGDCGSMLVGLVLGTLAIQSSLKAPATVALATPLVVLTLPIFDTTAAILRRKLTGRSLYTTDRAHLHHCLLRRGLSVWRVLFLVSFFCLATGLAGLASAAFNSDLIALLTGLAVIGTLIVTGLFGHAEARLVKERLVAVARSFVRRGAAGQPQQLEVRLQGSADWRPLWLTLKSAASRLNLERVRLDVNAPALHEGYHARWERTGDDGELPRLWRAEIPFTARGLAVGRVEIAGHPDAEPVWVKIAAVAAVVQEFEDAVPAPPQPERAARLVPGSVD
jgi:UDP-GlcNAc:undecaprenyl-phosphate GlcNAc-1-phosphate transferase